MAVNLTTTRDDKIRELIERTETLTRWAEGFDVMADALDALSLPLVDLEDVRSSVVARLRIDARRARAEIDALDRRVATIEQASIRALEWSRYRP